MATTAVVTAIISWKTSTQALPPFATAFLPMIILHAAETALATTGAYSLTEKTYALAFANIDMTAAPHELTVHAGSLLDSSMRITRQNHYYFLKLS